MRYGSGIFFLAMRKPAKMFQIVLIKAPTMVAESAVGMMQAMNCPK